MSGHSWTPAEDARLIELRGRGLSMRAIAEEIGLTRNTVQSRVRALGAAAFKPARGRIRAPREGEIPCLCCQKPFRSEGKHNRLCSPCKQRGGALSVFDAPGGNGCGRVVMGGG